MDSQKTFACAINCMDGRVQDAVKDYMKSRYAVDCVDMVTEPGPNRILAENADRQVIDDIKRCVEISVQKHGAKQVAIVGHFGCAGNPVDKEAQLQHLRQAKKTVESFNTGAEIVLLWVGDGFENAELVE